MNNKKLLPFILTAIVAFGIVIATGCIKTYELKLPELDRLVSISVEQSEKNVLVNNNEEMEEILNVLSGEKRTTHNASVQDYPVNVENAIKIDFNFADGGASRLFVYEKSGKNYIEQPYNGIYVISSGEYSAIQKILI